MTWLLSHGTCYQHKKQKDQRISYQLALLLKFAINVQFQIFHFNSSFDYLLWRINWRASHEVFCESFGCQMTYKIRPGHKELTSKNKFCKACIWRKRCRVRPRLSLARFESNLRKYLARATKEGINHYSYQRGSYVKGN